MVGLFRHHLGSWPCPGRLVSAGRIVALGILHQCTNSRVCPARTLLAGAENRDEEDNAPLDWIGALLATLSLGGLIYGLIESDNLGLSNPIVLGSVVIGLVALAAFIIVELRVKAPMMPLKLFRSHTFAGTNLLTLFLYAGLSGSFFFLPFDLIRTQGYPPAAANSRVVAIHDHRI